MLEEMGQARNAGRIVHRADLEPQHLGDDGRAMIGDHQHLHAVAAARTGKRLRRGSTARARSLARRGRRTARADGTARSCSDRPAPARSDPRTSQTSRRSLLLGRPRRLLPWRRRPAAVVGVPAAQDAVGEAADRRLHGGALVGTAARRGWSDRRSAPRHWPAACFSPGVIIALHAARPRSAGSALLNSAASRRWWDPAG